MELVKYFLIFVLVAQIWFSGLLKSLVGLVAWTVIWSVVVLVHNLFAAPLWSYTGFWVALWSWSESTWTDLVHANIGVGIASLMTLASLSGSSTDKNADAQGTGASESPPK